MHERILYVPDRVKVDLVQQNRTLPTCNKIYGNVLVLGVLLHAMEVHEGALHMR